MDFVSSLLRNPAWDSVLLFMLITGGFFWGITDGKKKMALMIVALYALSAIFPFVPIDSLSQGRAPTEIWMFRVAAFIALLALLTLFLVRSFKYASFKSEGSWWEIILMSILGAGFLAFSLLNLAPPEVFPKNLVALSPLTKTLFLNQVFFQWWVVLPILGVMFF